jgi:hypothetical protein
MPVQSLFWSAEEIGTLTRWWGRMTAGQLCEKLPGKSRSAIIAKVQRLREHGVALPFDKHYDVRPPRPRPKQPPKPRLRRKPPEETALQKLLRRHDSAPPLDARPCTLFQLSDFRCHFPLGDTDPQSPELRFCGAFKPKGVPYCAHHIRIAYTPNWRMVH